MRVVFLLCVRRWLLDKIFLIRPDQIFRIRQDTCYFQYCNESTNISVNIQLWYFSVVLLRLHIYLIYRDSISYLHKTSSTSPYINSLHLFHTGNNWRLIHRQTGVVMFVEYLVFRCFDDFSCFKKTIIQFIQNVGLPWF